MRKIQTFSELRRDQKEAIGLLQIGTFLEYFDLMLYVHMAVVLNELFFPKTDPHTAALLAAFAFCSTYVLRPFGALIFGYIGDHIGRKATVILTTMIMSISCIIMANLPTYAQIGVGASWIVTVCRIIQGMSSLGEIIGAEIYVTEITKPPVQYLSVSLISVASSIGALTALGIATLVTHVGFNWRIAFWIGAAIAMVGSLARTRLRETPEFVDMKRRMKLDLEQSRLDESSKSSEISKINKYVHQQKIKIETITAYFLVYCGWPLSFYLSFMYFNPILKSQFGYSSEDIISHNFLLCIIMCLANLAWSILGYTRPPLKILKIRTKIFIIFAFALPMLIASSNHFIYIFLIQSLILILTLGGIPADSIFIKHFPVFKRFTATSVLYALTRAIMYIVTSFGLVYLTTGQMGNWGLWIIIFPVTIGYLWGVNHFEKLEAHSSNQEEVGCFEESRYHRKVARVPRRKLEADF